MNRRFLLFCALIYCVQSTPVKAQNLPSGFSRVQVTSGISNPTVMEFAPDGRIFVGEQAGKLRVIKNGTLLSTPFVDLDVFSLGECGLLGIAFDPNFSSNNYVYLYYTPPGRPYNRISRFTANGDVAVAGSEQVILNLDPLVPSGNHNGGALRFGNDGKLYVAVGDNTVSDNSQNLDTYHGKLLRINPDGSIPSGNPWTSGSDQRRRVWAYGLRNPFTIDIEASSGRVFVNDVGGSKEEVNDATSGGRNFGWPTSSGGNSTVPGITSPVYYYTNTLSGGDNQGCAITGGTFLGTSTNYPSQYTGKYFYQDFCNGWINYIDPATGSRSSFATSLGTSSVGINAGPDGELYYLMRSDGALYKIVYSNNSAPNITNQPSNLTVSAGQSASFTVGASGSAPLSYQWRKDGTNISGANSSTYTIGSAAIADAGDYQVVVSNSAGSVTSSTATLTVSSFNQAPVAIITTPAVGTTYGGGQTFTFSGEATDAEDGRPNTSTFTWFLDFHHDVHVHDSPPIAIGTKAGSFTISTSNETSANVWYRLYLVVEDSGGLKDTTSVELYPRTSTLSFATEPAGLKITLDGTPINMPTSVLGVEGIIRQIGAISPQTLNGLTYEFYQWQHGGAISQTITTPTSDVTYTAVYRAAPKITSQPQDILVNEGQSASFSTTASGTAPLSYQWQKNGSNISGATSSTYTISSVDASDEGDYRVVVSNPVGNVTSSAASLTVTQVTVAPLITSQPQDVSVDEGQPASFSVTASGTAPLSYQWQKNGSNISGATSSNYTISNTNVSDEGNYRVVVNNGAGTATSSTASLQVITSTPPTGGAPTITNHPQSVTATEGQSASFSVTASDDDCNNLVNLALNQSASQSSTYADENAGKAVDGNTDGKRSSGSVTHTDQDLNAWWEVDLGIVADIGEIRVWNRTDCCSERLSDFHVMVSDDPFTSTNLTTTQNQAGVADYYESGNAGSPTVVSVNRPGRYVRVQLGGTNFLALAEVEVMGCGSGGLNYQWMKGGNNISGATSETYTIAGVSSADQGSYSVTVSNGSGTTTSNTATLSVTPQADVPQITSQPQDVTVIEGEPASFSVNTSQGSGNGGNLALNRPTSQSSTYGAEASSKAVDGNTDGNRTNGSITHTGKDQNAWWEVDLGSIESIEEILVWNRTDCCSERLTDFHVLVSDVPFTSTSLTVAQSQSGVSDYHQPGQAGNLTTIDINRTGRYIRVQLAGTDFLSLAEVEVLASEVSGSTNLALNKTATQSSPYGEFVPSRAVDGNTDGNRNNGSVSHTGRDDTAWWQVDLGAVEDINEIRMWNRTDCCSKRLENYHILVSDVPFASYSLNATQNQTGVGDYSESAVAGSPTIVAINRTGRYVRVQLEATEFLSLAEVEVIGGHSGGDPSLTYQWQKDGIDISGATSSTYSIASTTQSDQGNYRVIVANSAGSVTSSDASLTVTLTASAQASQITKDSTSKEEIPSDQIDVYPNPFDGELFVQYPKEWQLAQVELYNQFGKKVIYETNLIPVSQGLGKVTFDGNKLPAGAYYIKLSSSDWHRVFKKLVKTN